MQKNTLIRASRTFSRKREKGIDGSDLSKSETL
jgi:hypothetical protein